MKLNSLLLFVALVAVAFALLAWAAASIKNAIFADRAARARRPKIGNANRTFSRRHLRKFYLAPLLIERLAYWMGFTRLPRAGVQFANIGEGTYDTGIKSYTPDAATTARYLCYKIGTDGSHVAVCGAGDTPLGSSDDQADAGVPIAINLFGVKPGTVRVTTDGTIANGDHVKCAAAGQVTKAASTDRSFGIALIGTDASAAAGDQIEIMHCVPHLYVF